MNSTGMPSASYTSGWTTTDTASSGSFLGAVAYDFVSPAPIELARQAHRLHEFVLRSAKKLPPCGFARTCADHQGVAGKLRVPQGLCGLQSKADPPQR
jgi:hypothetical protein